MPYFNEVTNPKKALITRIVFRPKGLILCTENYDCFLFKDNKKAIALYQVLEWFQKHDEIQVQLWVHPDKKTKLGFDVLPGDAIKWYFSETEVTLEPQSSDEEELLKQIKALLPSFPTSHDDAMGERRRKKAGE